MGWEVDEETKMRLYEECLMFILENNIMIDRLPTIIQNEILALRKFYQVTRICVEIAYEETYVGELHFKWSEDMFEKYLSYREKNVICDCCQACLEWKRIEKEDEIGGLYLEELNEKLAKAKDVVKEASIKIPSYLSHLKGRISSICERDIRVGFPNTSYFSYTDSKLMDE